MYKYAHCLLDTQQGCAHLSLQMLANIKYEHDECAPVNQRMERYVHAAHTVHTTEIGLNLKEYFCISRFYSISILP